MNSKILTLLGFASKAGKLSYGMNSTTETIKRGKSKLAVLSGEVSAKSQKEINFHSEKNNVRVIVLDDCNIQTLSEAVGKKCGIISVNDISFADGILKAVSEISSRNNGGNV